MTTAFSSPSSPSALSPSALSPSALSPSALSPSPPTAAHSPSSLSPSALSPSPPTAAHSPSSTFSSSPGAVAAPRRAFKVLASIPRFDGKGEWLMRIGSGFQNRDDSINLYLDVIPLAGANGKIRLQIRELDAADLARREQYRASNAAAARGHDPASFVPPSPAIAANDGVPF